MLLKLLKVFAVYHVSNLFVLFKLFNIVHVHVYYNVLGCDYAPLWSNTQMHIYIFEIHLIIVWCWSFMYIFVDFLQNKQRQSKKEYLCHPRRRQRQSGGWDVWTGRTTYDLIPACREMEEVIVCCVEMIVATVKWHQDKLMRERERERERVRVLLVAILILFVSSQHSHFQVWMQCNAVLISWVWWIIWDLR